MSAARSARARVDRRRGRAQLRDGYGNLTHALALDPHWRVHRVVSTVGDVVVALVGGESPAAVLKWARTPRGTSALERSGEVVDALASDPRLTGWGRLLPRRLAAARSTDGHLAVLEQLLPGGDGRTVVTAATSPLAAASVMRCVATLHGRTATRTVVDQRLLDQWVERPAELIRARLEGRGPSAEGLERLREELHGCLRGRSVQVSWVHGDLAPDNVLLEPGTCAVSGLLDWERASPAGLPEVDEVHWQLTTQMLVERKELGDIVCERLSGDRSVHRGPEDMPLLMLGWLHHVSSNLDKSERYQSRGFWQARNLHAVLDRVAATPPRHPR